MSIELSSAPSKEPLTVAEAKEHIRVIGSSDDSYIEGLISLARKKVEYDTGRALITQTWIYRRDAFPWSREIKLEKSPLQSVSSITYYDENDSQQTLSSSNYDTSAKKTPGIIRLKSTALNWPNTYDKPDAVEITFIAGFGDDASDVPVELRHVIKLLVGHFYDFRQPILSGPQAKIESVPINYDNLVHYWRINR